MEMLWQKNQCTGLVIIHIVVILVVTILPCSCQEISTPANVQSLCPGDVITLTCVIRAVDNIVLSWRSADYIGTMQQLEFNILAGPGTTRSSRLYPTTVATLTNNTLENGVQVLTSELRITVRPDVFTFTVTCALDTSSTVDITLHLLGSYVTEIPGIVDIVSNQRENSLGGCTVCYSWSFPNNTVIGDVSHFMVHFNSSSNRSVAKTESNVYLMEQSVCTCASHNISIVAVDRCGQRGLVGEHFVREVSNSTCKNSLTTDRSDFTETTDILTTMAPQFQNDDFVIALSVVSVVLVVYVIITLIVITMMCCGIIPSMEKNRPTSGNIPLRPVDPIEYDEKNEEKI